MTPRLTSTATGTRHGIALGCFLALLIVSSPILLSAQPFTYDIDVSIRYDVTENGGVVPGTDVWGTPLVGPTINGTIDLVIDGAGNASGSTPLTGVGMLQGERIYSPDRNTWFEISGLTWGTPVGKTAPITGGTIDLTGSFMGDFSALTVTSGFLEDGNSGSFFNLFNGVGLDGKLQFTAVTPSGMTILYKAKGISGSGTGMHWFGVEGGSITYSNGADLASVGLMGVTSCYLNVDLATQTMSTPSPQAFLEYMMPWFVVGRQIDTFTGTIDPSGNFMGTAHYMGLEFASLDFVAGSGTFADGNSTGFDVSNGLALGDQFTSVLTDATGLFQLVINGTLVSQPLVTGIGDGGAQPRLSLFPNIPNPFNPSTRITFSLPHAGHARLVIYDVSGREVMELLNANLSPRTYSYTWDGRDHQGRAVASGVYFYRLEAAGESLTHKMVLTK